MNMKSLTNEELAERFTNYLRMVGLIANFHEDCPIHEVTRRILHSKCPPEKTPLEKAEEEDPFLKKGQMIRTTEGHIFVIAEDVPFIKNSPKIPRLKRRRKTK